MTFNEHVNEALARAEQERAAAVVSGDGAAARDFALAITHLEDALTRFNSGVYRRAGMWKRADAEIVAAVEIGRRAEFPADEAVRAEELE